MTRHLILALALAITNIASAAPTSGGTGDLCDYEDCGDGGGLPPPSASAYTLNYADTYYPTQGRLALTCSDDHEGIAQCSLRTSSGWIQCWVQYDPDSGAFEGAGCEYTPIQNGQ